MLERQHIIDLLRKTEKYMKEENSAELKKLSDYTVHSSSLGDADSIMVATTIYALSKIIERERYKQYKEWNSFYKHVLKDLHKARRALEKNNIIRFRKTLKDLRKRINKLSGNFKIYLQEIFRKAHISKASRIYEHGISMEKAAKLFGVTPFELAQYIGLGRTADVQLSITKTFEERYKMLKDFFEK